MQKQKLLVTHLLRDIQKLQMLRETQQRNGYFSFSFDILDEGILHLRTATFQDNCPVNMWVSHSGLEVIMKATM